MTDHTIVTETRDEDIVFSHQVDFMGNLTLRRSTGGDVFLQGDDAKRLKTDLERRPENEQTLISPYFDDIETPDEPVPDLHTYVVRGHWPFPADMLRHDGSRGATLEDERLIDRLSQDHAIDRGAFEDVEITLTGPSRPNTARWESFSWSVPGDEMHAWEKAAKERVAAEKAVFDGAMAKLDENEQDVVNARITDGRRH